MPATRLFVERQHRSPTSPPPSRLPSRPLPPPRAPPGGAPCWGRRPGHTYFLIKRLHLTRPGGLIGALTSRYTLDARNPAVRREIASLADLVGALRLPERAFARSSGTDVVVDLLVLRRRPPGAEPAGPAWERVDAAPIETGDGAAPLEVNELYLARRDRVLGELAASRGMYRDHELTVTPTGALAEPLPSALHPNRKRRGREKRGKE